MILATTDPATMAPRERLREIAELLAVGVLRARAADTGRTGADVVAPVPRNVRQKALDEATKSKPLCVPTPTARHSRDAAANGEHR